MKTSETILMTLSVLLVLEVSYLIYVTRRSRGRSKNTDMYVDTSVLMDGRILEIAKTGFITADLVIPRSVIGELQLLADGSDSEKRSRARYGLDIAQQLKACENLNVRLFQDGNVAREGVDDRLLSLVKKYGGMICTIDYNLNKVAQVEGINVVNVNELAKNVRFARLPGETMELELVQKGQDSHQGVGYLEDGTMVVVENASKYVGRVMNIEFIRAIQTDAGRMMFAKPVSVSTNKTAQSTKRKSTNASDSSKVKNKAANITRGVAKKVKTTRDTATKNPKDTKIKSAKTNRLSKSNNSQSGKGSRRKTNEDRLIDLVEGQR